MEGASTSHEVYWSAGVKINNERNWWISGGYFASGSISDSVIYDGASFGSFESLPNTADYRHHMIGVNDTHVVYLEGSYFGVRNAGLFDLTTNSWNSFTHLPDVSKLIIHHSSRDGTIKKYLILRKFVYVKRKILLYQKIFK